MELRIPSERIEVSEELDLLVAGGGSAGTLAAVSAA
jgi:glycerol-3-phosphate dehydrogenase